MRDVESFENLQLKEDKSFQYIDVNFLLLLLKEDRFHQPLDRLFEELTLKMTETRFGPVERRCQRSVALLEGFMIPKREYYQVEVLDFFSTVADLERFSRALYSKDDEGRTAQWIFRPQFLMDLIKQECEK